MDWRFWGLTKHEWAALHICFSLLCAVVAVLHVFFNWRSLVSYFKNRTTRRLGLRLEWVAAFLVSGLVGWATMVNLAPFSWLMSLRHTTRWGWAEPQAMENPAPEAAWDAGPDQSGTGNGLRSGGVGPGPGWGRMTLQQVCAEQNLEVSQVLAQLRKAGVRARPGQTLREIAAANGFERPRDVLDVILEE